MVKSILHAEGLSINILRWQYATSKGCDSRGLPYFKGARLRDLFITIESTQDITWWELAISNHRCIPKMVIELQPAILGEKKTQYIYLYDCHIVKHSTHFAAYTNKPMTETFEVTAQGMEMSHSVGVYSTPFRKTFDKTESKVYSSSIEEEEKDPKFLMAWWSLEKDSDDFYNYKRDSKAIPLGKTVYFNLEVLDINDGEEVEFQLFDYDHYFNIDSLDIDTNKFPNKEIIKKASVYTRGDKKICSFKLKLDPKWESVIKDDHDDPYRTDKYIELYWKVTYRGKEKTLQEDLPAYKDNYLRVSYDNRTLFVKSVDDNINIPEMYSFTGEPMFLLQYAEKRIKGEIKKKALNTAKGIASKQIRKIALAKAIRDNRLKNVLPIKNYLNDYYSNDKNLVNQLKSKTNWDIDDTTKIKDNPAIYYSQKGIRVQLLGYVQNIGNALNVFRLMKTAMQEDLNTDAPIPLDFGPLTPIAGVAGIFAQELKAEQDEILDQIIAKELDVAKQKGIEAVEKFVDTYSHTKNYKYELLSISEATACKLLNGDFESLDGLLNFDSTTQQPNSVKLLYKEELDPVKERPLEIVESIFINQ